MSTAFIPDFFISYTQTDLQWAEWVAWHLEDIGYNVIIQAWDFAPGENFLAHMDSALTKADRTLLILTPEALSSHFVREEWTAALKQNCLIPLRVKECDPKGLLGTRNYIDLVGLEESETLARLKSMLKVGRRKPDTPPSYPGVNLQSKVTESERPRFPGTLSSIIRRIKAFPGISDSSRFGLQLDVWDGERRRPLMDIFTDHKRIILHGPPGSGKTVFLRKIASTLAEELSVQQMADMSKPSRSVPIYLELGLATEGRTLNDLISQRFEIHEGITAFFSELLSQYSVMLLLDGFNELPESRRRIILNNIIELGISLDALEFNNTIRIIVTSRTYGLGEQIDQFKQFGFAILEVAPLQQNQIEQELATILNISSSAANKLFRKLTLQDRILINNPQHLDYIIQWFLEAHSKEIEISLKSRAALLDYSLKKRMNKIPEQFRDAARMVARKMAYKLNNGIVFFSKPDLISVAKDVAEKFGGLNHLSLTEYLFEIEVFVTVNDRCRFYHHSHQQYWLAVEMTHRPSEYQHYVADELWHEPLVIMVGLLDGLARLELLDHLRLNRPLFAYVVANIDEPELARRFSEEIAKEFTVATDKFALHSARRVVAFASLWFAGIPCGLIILASPISGVGRIVANAFYVVYMIGGLPVALWWHRQNLVRELDMLRNVKLPELIAVGRLLQRSGLLAFVQNELSKIQTQLTNKGFDQEEPRLTFVSEALRIVREADNTVTYLSEDEQLAQLDDPIVAATLDPAIISYSGIEAIIQMVVDSRSQASKTNALKLIRGVYLIRPEFRESILSILHKVLDDHSQPQTVRLQATKLIAYLRDSEKHRSRFEIIIRLLRTVFEWVRKITVDFWKNF